MVLENLSVTADAVVTKPAEPASPPPMFNFPPEEPRTFTAADLIAILALYNARFKKNKPSGTSRLPTVKELSIKEAMDLLLGDSTRKRVVFRHWPRAPDGKAITPENSLPGKMTPNGVQLWGATLFDFYRVRRHPDIPGLSTITTGSKLMKWMKANGELDYAEDELELAEMEEKPKVIDPWSPQEEIEKMEGLIRQAKAGRSMPDAKGKNRSTGSVFDSSNYPAPWPLVPFSYQTQRLTSIIDLDRLPKKLVVHDPWNLLAVRTRNRYGRAETQPGSTEWTSRPDRMHVYKLKLSNEAEARLQAEATTRAAQAQKNTPPKATVVSLEDENEDEEDGQKELEGYLLRPPAISGPIPPPIFVTHDPRPKPTAPVAREHEPIPEAHLYISPAHPIGRGNHSVVYQAEWELPRSAIILTPDQFVLCDKCVRADVSRILKETDGENGERMHPRWKEKTAMVKLVREGGRPSVTFHVVSADAIDKPDGREFTTPDTSSYRVDFEGQVRPIRTRVAWQDRSSPTCEHLTPIPVPALPPTVKMRVVAKLSNERDQHLAREAGNYMSFERHVFEHWSGYNVLPPMHDPVPVGPLVPRFYGHYVPEDEEEDHEKDRDVLKMGMETNTNTNVQMEEKPVTTTVHANGTAADGIDVVEMDTDGATKKNGKRVSFDAHVHDEEERKAKKTRLDAENPAERKPKPRGYISPILLLEDCGREVNPDVLTLDQKHEALSLIYRFHYGGWAHGSVFVRNILTQPGPLDVPPAERSKETPSFRLIDFGRSYHYDDPETGEAFRSDRPLEENYMEKIFGLGLFS